MNVTEAANALGISRQRVHKLLQAGELKGEKVSPRSWIVTTESVNARKKEGRPEAA